MMASCLGIVLILYELFSWAGGSPCFKRSSAEFSTEFYELEIIFLNLTNFKKKGVVNHFSNGLEYQMSCESLDRFWEIGTYARARGNCHMSTFLGQGVIILLVSELSGFQNFCVIF